MTANVIPTFQVEQFATNIALLLQQTDSRLGSAVNVGSYVGKQGSPVEQIGAIEMTPVTSRFAPMGRVDATTDRRWVFPSDFELPQLLDSFDQLRLIVDPKSALVQSAVAAANRKKDAIIYAAMFGTAKTGESGATSTILPTSTSTNVVSVDVGGAASSLNLAKLRTAKKFLMAAQVDLAADPIYCAITSKEHDALLNEIQVVNTDYSPLGSQIVNGMVKSVLGINFIHYEAATTATDDQSGTSNQIPFFAKSGMHLGMWNDLEADVSQRKDLQGQPWQVYTKMTLGATRIEEKKMVKIWCR